MILIYDTETTGLAVDGVQPWPISIAAVLLDDKLQIIDTLHSLIKIPSSIPIHPKALEAHGMSHNLIQEKGADMKEVMDIFHKRFVSPSLIRMAYNIKFDDDVIKAFVQRINYSLSPLDFFSSIPPTCLMKLATNYLRIPGGHQGYRSVTLTQAHRRITGIPVFKAHDALHDVHACVDIYRSMLKSMVIPSA